MKTIFACKALLCSCALSFGGANYPEISPETQFMLDQVQGLGEIKSEWTKIEPGQFVAIYMPSIPCKGYVFEASFVDVYWLPGFKAPVLNFIGGDFGFAPSFEIGHRQYEDRTKVFYGATMCFGEKVYLYGTTAPGGSDKSWTMSVTWGDGSDVNTPGKKTDRLHLGSRPGEPLKLGFEIRSIDFIYGKPLLRVFYDTQAEFILEASDDLVHWHKEDFDLYPVPGTEKLEGYVKSEEAVLKPHAQGFGAKQFFRLKDIELRKFVAPTRGP